MARAEGDLWWYRALHHLAADTLAGHPRGREARIVDAGCGTGGLLRFLQRHGYRQTAGFDLSPEAVRIGRERGLPVRQWDLRRLDQAVGPETVDALISNDTLCYFTPADQERMMGLFWQALAPGGLLIIPKTPAASPPAAAEMPAPPKPASHCRVAECPPRPADRPPRWARLRRVAGPPMAAPARPALLFGGLPLKPLRWPSPLQDDRSDPRQSAVPQRAGC